MSLKVNKEQAREGISYLVFGVLTTLLNIQTYVVLSQHIGLSIAVSNIIAWVVGVIFAYITNKLIVFKSKDISIKYITKELGQFVMARLATGIIDEIIVVCGAIVVAGMTNENIINIGIKIFSNILVVILNYVFSKLIVFRGAKRQ